MTQIGRYEIVRRTGQTPLGTIYEAVDSKTHLPVAIQATTGQPDSGMPTWTKARTALEERSESLGRLNHTHIRNLLAVEHADGRMFLVMEHLDAKPFATYIATHPASSAEVVKLLKDAAAALDYAHDRSVFHPGLTPAHLLVDSNGVLKIAGFEMPGMDALSLKTAGAAERSDLERSAPYRAPEFLYGEAMDGRADQFALAAIAYELLTGQRLFEYSSAVEAMAAILLNKTTDLALVEAATTQTLRRVLERALAYDPAHRYATCERMVVEMEVALVRKTPSAPTRVTDSSSFDKPGMVEPSIVRAKTPVQIDIPGRIALEKHRFSQRIVWMVAATIVAMLVVVGLIVKMALQKNVETPSIQESPLPSNHIHQTVEEVIRGSQDVKGSGHVSTPKPATGAQPDSNAPTTSTAPTPEVKKLPKQQRPAKPKSTDLPAQPPPVQ